MTRELFDKCVAEAITLGRKYMRSDGPNTGKPTTEEWFLACLLYMKNIHVKRESG